MAEAFARPRLEVRDRLVRRGLVESPQTMLASDDAEDLYVDDVWRGLLLIQGQP